MSAEMRQRLAKLPEDRERIHWQREYRQCCKRECQCFNDETKRHGPYWYAYWQQDRRQHRVYIGREIPYELMGFSEDCDDEAISEIVEDVIEGRDML